MTKFSLLLILILSPIIASGQTLEARLAIKHEKQILLLQLRIPELLTPSFRPTDPPVENSR
jgi:hypothetical protein